MRRFFAQLVFRKLALLGAVGGLLGAWAASAASIGPLPGVSLMPHRAVYELSLARGESGGGVAGARGRLALEFADACGGFALNQRIVMQLENADGGVVESDFSIASFESRDGLKYRFNLRNEINGQLAEEFSGQAELSGRGKGGRAAFSKPEGLVVDLPPGTVYPTEHLALLVREATAGKAVAPARVFDGSGDDGVFDVSGFIGRELPKVSGDDRLLAPVKGLRAWRVRLAYFPIAKPSDQPQYEVGFRLFENGISDELLLDYGDFAMRGVLTVLEPLSDPGC